MKIPAIVLNDYPDKHYATWVEEGKKVIETRGRKFEFSGDILICCGAKSATKNAGLALCVVYMDRGRFMKDEDEAGACIENAPGRIAYPLSNRRLLSYKFKFTDYATKKNYQGIFEVDMPDFVKLTTTKT